MARITAATVRADFNDLAAVLHYTRAAHGLGLWASERLLIERFFPDREAPLLEAGCGAGRVTLGLWALGYRQVTAFDFAAELLDQARSLAENRRRALAGLHAACLPGATLLFTSHDRESSRTERALWRLEAERWARGEQDPRLVEFGDRYFTDENGRTFMHLPDRAEVLADLAATGWTHRFDAARRDIARETSAVREFSDECRFWAARRE